MVRIRIHTSLRALEQLRRVWDFIRKQRQGTIFQDFDLNLLAARTFSDREELFVVLAEASYGLAIVPAVRSFDEGSPTSSSSSSLRLLGEELFDYRGVLYAGEEDVAHFALGALAQARAPLQVVAIREADRHSVFDNLQLEPFTIAPFVSRAHVSGEEFGAKHARLARNLRRFRRQGFEVKAYSGAQSSLLRSIYQGKSEQDRASLFHDYRRVEFMIEAGQLQPGRFEIFTLESQTELAAALVTFREPGIRRFYTCFFRLPFAKLSPAMALIHEVTRLSLNSGLDCDYMTGEQGYKMRLATGSVPLYRLGASAEQLAMLAKGLAALRRAG